MLLTVQYVFIIYLFGKDLYPANGTASGSQIGTSAIIVQFTKRKTKNTRGSNGINKKAIFLVAVGPTGIGMTNLVYIL
jgi:hypothetical protein